MRHINTQLIDGTASGQHMLEQLALHLAQHQLTPGLTVILVGCNPASLTYVKIKQRRAAELGIRCQVVELPETATTAEIEEVVRHHNLAPDTDGIIVQMPLPSHVERWRVIDAIDPAKDVDGFHVSNVGSLHGLPDHHQTAFVPCTALGVLHLIHQALGHQLSGLTAVVIGRSAIVGQPTAALLLHQDCTVTIAHSQTVDLPALCARADILVAAAGRRHLIRGSWIKPGACVIDVGINKSTIDGKITGDVMPDEAQGVAGFLTPVPGGVGPMTVAYLLLNTIRAHCIRQRQPLPHVLPQP